MKILINAFLVIQLLASCKKSNSLTTPSILYKINGRQVQISGDGDTSHIDPITGAYYGCYAIKPNGSTAYFMTGENKTDGMLLTITTSDNLLHGIYNAPFAQVTFRMKLPAASWRGI